MLIFWTPRATVGSLRGPVVQREAGPGGLGFRRSQ